MNDISVKHYPSVIDKLASVKDPSHKENENALLMIFLI